MALTVSIDLFFCCGLLPWHPVKTLKTGLQPKPLLGWREQTEPSTSYSTIVQKFWISSMVFYWFRPFGLLPWSQHQTFKLLGCFRVNQRSHKVKNVGAFRVVFAMCVCLWSNLCLIRYVEGMFFSDWGEHGCRQAILANLRSFMILTLNRRLNSIKFSEYYISISNNFCIGYHYLI